MKRSKVHARGREAMSSAAEEEGSLIRPPTSPEEFLELIGNLTFICLLRDGHMIDYNEPARMISSRTEFIF